MVRYKLAIRGQGSELFDNYDELLARRAEWVKANYITSVYVVIINFETMTTTENLVM